tara:strand:- start:43 stop:294 length:252 start_codon:yes stop_codon:yes gene_type:complete
MATNPDFYLDEEFIQDKAVNELLNIYNKKYKNAYELLPINVDYTRGNILSNFEILLKTALRQKRKLSTENVLEMINNVERRIY